MFSCRNNCNIQLLLEKKRYFYRKVYLLIALDEIYYTFISYRQWQYCVVIILRINIETETNTFFNSEELNYLFLAKC